MLVFLWGQFLEHLQPAVNGHCHNCGAATTGKFCAACGQETTLHVASAREFLHEFVGHYVALEGKLWKTLALLLFRPGKLTTEYIAGRRARYVQPLRIYLTFSILFFALLKYGPHPLVSNDTPQRPVASASEPAEADGVRVNTKIGSINPAWEARIKQIAAMPREQSTALLKATIFGYVPYAMFCLMPVFALYLKLLYLRSARSYGEHMLFALHTNAFAFLMLGVTQSLPWSWIDIVLLAWLLAYLPWAMQRVYGGGKLATGLRWLVLMAVYTSTAAAVVFGTLFAAAIMV
ncbi:MAG: hypothetical protein JWQ01_1348 [Massilia sp.]|nr:hypothetical protein [Massilia sp.]